MGQQIAPGVWRFTLDQPGGESMQFVGRGKTEEEAKADAAKLHNQRVQGVPRGQVPTSQDKQNLDFTGRFKQALVGSDPQAGPRGLMQSQGPSDPNAFVSTLQGAGELLLPGSNAEAAVMAALPFVGKAASVIKGAGTAAKAARAATRIGLGTGAGAVGGAIEGGPEGAKQGAITGAVATGVGELFTGTGSLIEAAANKWGNLDTKAFNTRVRDVLGPEAAHRVMQDIPSLQGKVPLSTDGLVNLLDAKRGGLRIIGDLQDAKEQEIARFINANTGIVNVPTAAVDLAGSVRGPAAASGAKGPITQVGTLQGGMTTQRSPEQAIKLAKVLRQKGAAAQGPDAVEYFNAREEILNALQAQAGPKLGGEYAALRGDYGKMAKLQGFLGERPDLLFPANARGAKQGLDLVQWGDRLMQNFADVNPTDFPALTNMFLGTGGEMSRAAAGKLPIPFAHSRVGVPIPGLPHVRAYEGGRMSTTQLPPRLQEQVPSPLPGRLETAGKIAAPGLTPTIGQATE